MELARSGSPLLVPRSCCKILETMSNFPRKKNNSTQWDPFNLVLIPKCLPDGLPPHFTQNFIKGEQAIAFKQNRSDSPGSVVDASAALMPHPAFARAS